MTQKIAICPQCHTKVLCKGEVGEKIPIECPACGIKGSVVVTKTSINELDFYPLNEPFAYAKILRDTNTIDTYYKVIEPHLSEDEQHILRFIQQSLVKSLDKSLNDLDVKQIHDYLEEHIQRIVTDYKIQIDDLLRKKIFYYVQRDSIGYGRIDALMRDQNIEDISCDGPSNPVFLYHRNYDSLRSNVEFTDEEELSAFVVKLAQKCGKHISIAEPMLDATMPEGSRIQMTLSTEITTKGSTFTIRKFKDDPITPTDLIAYNTMSPEMVAYMWLAVENGISALISGGTASGKTSTLNALSLFIPRDSKIVSIEETREINLPHPNWIPGVARSGFGEVINEKMRGEIDMYELMKAALRQRPEYIIVGEIRGKEAYVLFQAMATGHTTYSTVHADSAKSLIHRLEGKPINIPRIMLQALDIVCIQVSTRVGEKRVRRCKQIIEIIDIDPVTKEILTNEVFRWDQIEDRFIFSGKSYVLERIRARWDMDRDDIAAEIKKRVEILQWLRANNKRSFLEVADMVARYSEMPDEFMKTIRMQEKGTVIKDTTLSLKIDTDQKQEKKKSIGTGEETKKSMQEVQK